MKLIRFLPLALLFIFCIPQQTDEYVGEVYIFTKCTDRADYYNPVNAAKENARYFFEKRIRVYVDTTMFSCGYMLVNRFGRQRNIEATITAKELTFICDNFFFAQDSVQYKLLR